MVYIPNSANKDPSLFDECLKVKIPKWSCYFISGDYKETIKKTSKKANIEFIDSSQVIDRYNDQFYAPKGAHLSKEGYDKVADLISNEINK